jgi:hypothetical protein
MGDQIDGSSLAIGDLDLVKISSHLFVISILILFLYESLSLSSQAAAIPQLILFFALALLVIYYARAYTDAQTVHELLTNSSSDGIASTEDTPMEVKGISIENINFKPFVAISGWMLAFAVSAFVIDFFISTFFFCLGYIIWKRTGENVIYRIGYSVGGASIITIFLWIIMIDILERTLLIDVGLIDVFELLDFVL